MAISTEFRQQHFQLFEIILPYCTVCTPVNGLNEAWHTPVTCIESSDSEYSLWLSSQSVPPVITQPSPSLAGIKSILNSKIFRCVISNSESTASLKTGEGLAGRGTMSIRCNDFSGDPGPINFSDDGTFFGKLRARNILEGKKIVTHYFAISGPVGLETVENVGTSTHYITNTELSNGEFRLSAKDALKDIEALSQKFPEPSSVVLTSDINTSTTSIPVSDTSPFSVGSVFRIDNELFYVNSIGAGVLNVASRGTAITGVDGVVVYKTNVNSHSSDSTVQPCYVMNKTPIYTMVSDLFSFAGLGDFIDLAQWQSEVDEWNSQAFLYGVFSKPDSISDIINKKLSDYLIDMWLDQNTQKVKMSAVSAWKEGIRILTEGNDLSDLSIKEDATRRFSRAIMYNKKEYKAETDDIINYSKLTVSSDVQVESADFYGSIKLKDLGFSDTITTGSAQTTVARYVQRFSRAPKEINFVMEERKLDKLSVSDIVDIVSRDSQTPSGQVLSARDRAQIIRIQPKFGQIGRQYNVTALSYIPLIASNPNEELVIILSGNLFDVNLFARAGAPNVPINVTFVLDGCVIGSTDNDTPAVRAGAFEAGSRIKIICTNGTKWSAKGGENYNITYPSPLNGVPTGNRANGADAYQSDSVETHLYLNYGSVDGYSTDCTMYASGGAGGIGVSNFLDATVYLTAPGGGGSGITFGSGGDFTRFGITTKTSGDGSFSSGGAGGTNGFTEIPSLQVFGGAGGFSLDGSAPTNYPLSLVSQYGPTLAGGAVVGNNITVYNLSSQSSKFRQGRSSAFTLIDS